MSTDRTTAETEATNADRRADELTEQRNNGDTTVTSQDINRQRELAHLARIRAAASRHADAREDHPLTDQEAQRAVYNLPASNAA
ncbi:hypothetical protein [Nocardiopsis dassonvillei]|uniref:hypothetical protein n=1 Tax=Nocardiopsis dassonvillei TaxID=2014 RepID=UPI003645287A